MRNHRRSWLAIAGTIVVYILIFWAMLPGFLLSVGFRMDKLVPLRLSTAAAFSYVGWAGVAFGLGFILLSMGQLWVKGKGLPISHLPPSQFVSTGIYRYFRHPLYVGYTAAFAGLSLLLRSSWSLAFSTPLLVFGWLGYSLFYEEPILLARFGDAYRDYKKKTPFLLPKMIGRWLQKAFRPVLELACRWVNRIADWTVFFRRGPVILVSYGIFIALGSFISMLHASSLFLLQGIEKKHVAVFLAGTVLLTFLFAHLFWWVGHWKDWRRRPVVGFRLVGFVSYGALFGIALACLAFARGFGYPLLLISDVAVRGLYIAYAIGRIGCLTYGCCWGKASLSYGILYRNPEAKVVRMSGGPSPMLHPAPLYSAIEGLVLFIILNSLCYFPLPPGFLTVFGLLLYPMGRAFIEPYRERRFYLSSALNEGHIGCALMFLAGVIMLFLISPGMGPSSPRPLNLEGFIQGLSLIPVILAVSALVFFMTGFHWRKVGTW